MLENLSHFREDFCAIHELDIFMGEHSVPAKFRADAFHENSLNIDSVICSVDRALRRFGYF